ncbi:MAG: type I-C CRISPR-associated protein Cas7/Csd2 [Elusimicrobiales bacterium]
MTDTIKNRYDFVYVFDVQDGNPNGDPDAGNLPRIDPETGRGIVTDVCLKRKVRNYVQLDKKCSDGHDIFVKEKAVLNKNIADAYAKLGIDLEKEPNDVKDGKKRNSKGEAQGGEVEKGRVQMCKNYYDIRTFGAVMSTGANAGQVRGPVQLTFARSVDPVVTLEHSITRMAVATEAEAEKQSGDNRTMGRKTTIPYGIYVAHGFISAPLASQTGFNDADLELFWNSLVNMFEHDRSAARGLMSARKLVIFKHDDAMGSAPASKLFDLVKITRATDAAKPAREFTDYKVDINRAAVPPRVTVIDDKI